MEEENPSSNHKSNKFSLKNENEDNLIENDSKEDKESSQNSDLFQDTKKYKLKYNQLLKILRNRDKPDINYENEFYCNILLMPSFIDFGDKLSTLCMVSYCYQVRDNYNLIYYITNKFDKKIQYINNVSPDYFIKVFCRAGFYFKKQNNVFYAYKYILKCVDIINKNKLKFGDKTKNKINQYLKDLKEDLPNYIKSKEAQFKDKNNITESKCIEIKELIDLIILEKNNLDLTDDEENNYIYAINRDWLFKLKFFIEPYLSKFENKDKYINEIFEPEYVYKSYFDETVERNIKSGPPYPGPINNIPLISFKDCWIDNINQDENIFLKKNLELNKNYYYVNYKDWELLNSIFDCTNEIKRKKNNLDLIQLKFILYDKRIRVHNHNIYLLKQKNIQINKNSTVKQLKDKILDCVNHELKFFNEKNIKKSKQEVCFYILNKDKKDILIEITIAFTYKIQMYESLYIEKLEIKDDNTLSDFLIKYDKKKYILIIEIMNKGDCNFLIQMDKKYKCSICGKKIKNLKEKYNCEICHFSLFCSYKCSRNSDEHIELDKNLKTIFVEKFVLSDLISLDLNTLWMNGHNVGRIGLNNLGNSCYMNSVLQCLSNTRDLTKYFLNESFKKEINNGSFSGLQGEISQAYYELIKQLWNGHNNEYIETKSFKNIFCNRTKLFNTQEQQDAHDFLISFLENLHDELNRVTNKPYMTLEEQKEGESDEVTSGKWWDYYKSRDDSIIVDLFKGQYKITNKCSGCGYKSVTFDHYMTLDLPIPQKKSQYQFKFLTNNGNYIDLNLKLDEKTEIKDIILKSIIYLDRKNYIEYAKKCEIEGHLFNYNIEHIPDSILYNNIQVIEFSKDFKMQNIFDCHYENINKNSKETPFDNMKYLDFSKKRTNSEIVLFEKDINSNLENYIDVYIYPVAEFERENIVFNIVKVIKIISYPVIVSIKKNDSLKSLQVLIFKKFNKILESQGRNFYDSIEICFPHFNDKWNNFKIKDKICPICKKAYDKNTKFCSLFDSIQKSATIFNLINNMSKDRPLILFAKSSLYNPNLNLYKGIQLLFDKKNEIESKVINLYDALDLLNKEDVPDDDNTKFCDKCKKKMEKKIELYKTPYYLIIHLNRFKRSKNNKIIFIGKNDTFIEYKEILNLKDFVIGPNKNISLYDLYGVVLHKNFMNLNNHYISYCKNYGMWFSYDDTTLNHAENPINKDAYILFYKRRSFQ